MAARKKGRKVGRTRGYASLDRREMDWPLKTGTHKRTRSRHKGGRKRTTFYGRQPVVRTTRRRPQGFLAWVNKLTQWWH